MKVKHSPLVTIVTISLNCKSSLEETISSVCSQDYSRIEYIIVDGGSTDGSLSIIDSYNWCVDKTISEKDDGIYSAMNKGLKMASKNSDFITFLNAGDTFYDRFVISNLIYTAEKRDGHFYGDVVRSEDVISSPAKLTLSFLSTGMVCHQSIFFKTRVHSNNIYNTKYKIASDYELILRLVNSGERFSRLDFVVAKIEAGGVSGLCRGDLHEEKKYIRDKIPFMKVLYFVSHTKKYIKKILNAGIGALNEY